MSATHTAIRPVCFSVPQQKEKDDLIVFNLEHILDKWDQGISKHHDAFKILFSQDLRRITVDENAYRTLMGHDYAQLYARMYNKCDLDTLERMALLTMWLIHLDDKVDCQIGDLHDCSTRLGLYMTKLRIFVSQCLGSNMTVDLDGEELDNFTLLFEPLSWKLRKLPKDKLDFFQLALDEYLEALVEEHRMVKRGGPWTMQEYMHLRHRTICVVPICTLAGTLLSESAHQALDICIPELLPLWEILADVMIFTNDIVSLRNEINKPEVANSVKLLSVGMPVTKGIDIATSLLLDAVARFEERATAFTAEHPAEQREAWNEYFAVLKSIVGGYYKWSLTTIRYGNLKDTMF